MLFAHLSDLHLGKRLCEAPLLGDQQDILRQVLALLDGQPVRSEEHTSELQSRE